MTARPTGAGTTGTGAGVTVAALTPAGVLAALIILRKREHRPLLSFVLLPVILLMFIAGRWLGQHGAHDAADLAGGADDGDGES